MSSPTNQVQLTIVEDVLGELIVLEAPAAQIAIGPQLSDTTPVALGTAAAGTASSAARGDHVHAHGNLSGSSLHAVASTSAAGFMSAAQFDLLAAATEDDDASTLVKRDSLGDFSAGTITADLIGNAATVTTNADLTGDVTSVGNATSIAAGVIVDADINASAGIAVAKLADGSARQLLQTNAAGDGVEWTSNIDVPGTLDVTGAATFDAAVTIQGDLTVNGTETIINTQTLDVEDKNIVIGKVDTPTDATADGGGITLKGATDKTINWVDATDAWTSSEHVNLASAKEYRIAGAKVLDATSLGSAVTTSSLTSVETIGTGVWEGTAINKTYLDATLVSTGDSGTVTSAMIANETIVNADINASAAIADTKLDTISTAGKVSNSATTADSDNTASAIVARDASGNFAAGDITIADKIVHAGDTDTAIRFPAADTFTIETSGAERFRVGSGGNVGIGTTAPESTLHVAGLTRLNTAQTPVTDTTSAFSSTTASSNTGNVALETFATTTSTRHHISFVNTNGVVGSISTVSSSTAYNTSSDYRLKENITLLDGAIARLNQLPVHRFNFIADPDTVVDGFIAHEAAAVVPECVTGEKDEVDENGNPVYQGIDQSKVVPLLTAALQEAIAMIGALETRIAALEA